MMNGLNLEALAQAQRVESIGIQQEGSVEGLNTYDDISSLRAELFAQYQSMHGDEAVRAADQPKKPKSSLHQTLTGEYEWAIDIEVLFGIIFDDRLIRSGFYKEIFQLKPGDTISVSTTFQMDPRSMFFLMEIMAVLQIIRTRGIVLNFRINSTCSYCDVALMSLCDDIKIGDFGFIALGRGIVADAIGPFMADIYHTYMENIFDFLIEKNLISQDEKQLLVDNPDENSIFLTAEEIRQRLGR